MTDKLVVKQLCAESLYNTDLKEKQNAAMVRYPWNAVGSRGSAQARTFLNDMQPYANVLGLVHNNKIDLWWTSSCSGGSRAMPKTINTQPTCNEYN